jgi:hypothetical protein
MAMGKNHINLRARRERFGTISHRIHGAGIYANIWGILMVNVTIYGIHGSYGYVSIFPIKRYQIGSYHELPRVSQSHDRLGKMMRYGCLDDFGMDMIEPMLRKSDSGGSRSRDADWPIVEFLSWLTFS